MKNNQNMNSKEKTIEAIFDAAWELLQTYRDPEQHLLQIYAKEATRKLTTLDDDNIPVTEEVAKILLTKWIIDSIETGNMVCLYTCRDNYEISIDDCSPDAIEYFDEQPLENTDIKFYLGWD